MRVAHAQGAMQAGHCTNAGCGVPCMSRVQGAAQVQHAKHKGRHRWKQPPPPNNNWVLLPGGARRCRGVGTSTGAHLYPRRTAEAAVGAAHRTGPGGWLWGWLSPALTPCGKRRVPTWAVSASCSTQQMHHTHTYAVETSVQLNAQKQCKAPVSALGLWSTLGRKWVPPHLCACLSTQVRVGAMGMRERVWTRNGRRVPLCVHASLRVRPFTTLHAANLRPRMRAVRARRRTCASVKCAPTKHRT